MQILFFNIKLNPRKKRYQWYVFEYEQSIIWDTLLMGETHSKSAALKMLHDSAKFECLNSQKSVYMMIRELTGRKRIIYEAKAEFQLEPLVIISEI